MLPLLRDKEIWTLGADSPDIDWEAMWKRRLRDLPDYKRSGGPLRPAPKRPCRWLWALGFRVQGLGFIISLLNYRCIGGLRLPAAERTCLWLYDLGSRV